MQMSLVVADIMVESGPVFRDGKGSKSLLPPGELSEGRGSPTLVYPMESELWFALLKRQSKPRLCVCVCVCVCVCCVLCVYVLDGPGQ